ncbi:MAG TPA: sigma factor-like helix-turn-helix DNA-binding protein [Gemmatimonadaceae bacterium]|nr:sigma factor-like helix-turn-helix DNA-binding protein [Gemmatimonadaceae bacterium]
MGNKVVDIGIWIKQVTISISGIVGDTFRFAMAEVRRYAYETAHRHFDPDDAETIVGQLHDYVMAEGAALADPLVWHQKVLERAKQLWSKLRRDKRRTVRGVIPNLGNDYALGGGAPDALTAIIIREGVESLETAMAEIPELQQDVLRMRFWEKMTWPEIGESLDVHKDSPRKTFGRALISLGGAVTIVRLRTE